jgi:hypothetical protein
MTIEAYARFSHETYIRLLDLPDKISGIGVRCTVEQTILETIKDEKLSFWVFLGFDYNVLVSVRIKIINSLFICYDDDCQEIPSPKSDKQFLPSHS